MNRLPDMDTREGVACDRCGEDGSFEQISGHPEPICDACYYDLTDICPDCGEQFWMADMERVVGLTHLFCASCASEYASVALGRQLELVKDERAGK